MPIGRWSVACGVAMLFFAAGCTLFAGTPRNFEECVRAGYPVMETYPRRCAAPGGPTFSEPWAGPPEITPVPQAPDRVRKPRGAWAEAYIAVEALTVEPAGSDPTRAVVRIVGTLSDPCTYIFPIDQVHSDHRVSLDLRAWHDTEMACIAVIEPFDLRVPLEQPLTAGTWTIAAGGLSTTYLVPGFDD
jgi:hypothetical protein